MEIYRQFEALWHAGQDASLHLECHAGQVRLNLQVHLQQHQKFFPSPKNSPSRQRRRERRKAARTAAANAVEASKVELENVAAEVAVPPPPKDVLGGCAEQVVPGRGHHLESQQHQPHAGRDGCECPTAAAMAPPQPFTIAQLDGHYSDAEVEPDNKSIKADRLSKLSITNVCTTDIPPDPYPCRFCLLVSELPNYPSPKPTDPVCAICHRPIDDRFNPHKCCDLLMHENCWGPHRCISWE